MAPRKVAYLTPLYFDEESCLGGGERYPLNLARGVHHASGGRCRVELISFGERGEDPGSRRGRRPPRPARRRAGRSIRSTSSRGTCPRPWPTATSSTSTRPTPAAPRWASWSPGSSASPSASPITAASPARSASRSATWSWPTGSSPTRISARRSTGPARPIDRDQGGRRCDSHFRPPGVASAARSRPLRRPTAAAQGDRQPDRRLAAGTAPDRLRAAVSSPNSSLKLRELAAGQARRVRHRRRRCDDPRPLRPRLGDGPALGLSRLRGRHARRPRADGLHAAGVDGLRHAGDRLARRRRCPSSSATAETGFVYDTPDELGRISSARSATDPGLVERDGRRAREVVRAEFDLRVAGRDAARGLPTLCDGRSGRWPREGPRADQPVSARRDRRLRAGLPPGRRRAARRGPRGPRPHLAPRGRRSRHEPHVAPDAAPGRFVERLPLPQERAGHRATWTRPNRSASAPSTSTPCCASSTSSGPTSSTSGCSSASAAWA